MKKTVLALIVLFTGTVVFAAEPAMFPEIRGWKLQVDKKVYTADNLWEVIDGAAELYLAYNFQDLHQAIYATENEREVKVELYRHDNPVNTYGIYAAERMPDYTFIETGVQGYTSPDILNFFTGCYYVKISSYGRNDVDEETLKAFAGEVSLYLNQTGSWPGEVHLFPPEGKMYMSDGYVASNFMGYGFFRFAFTARYSAGGEFTLFIIHGKEGEAETMLNKYTGMVKEDSIRKKGNIYIVPDPYNGKVLLSKKGNYLVGVLNAADEMTAMEYIGKTMVNIPEE
jgi:hypothetical protein